MIMSLGMRPRGADSGFPECLVRSRQIKGSMELPPTYSTLSVLPWAGGTPVRCGTAAFSGKAASTIPVDITRAVSYLKYLEKLAFQQMKMILAVRGILGFHSGDFPGSNDFIAHHSLAPRPQKSQDLCTIPVSWCQLAHMEYSKWSYLRIASIY